MSPDDTAAISRETGPKADPDWRESLLSKFRYVIIISISIVSLTVFLSARTAGLRWLGICTLAITPVFHLVLSSPKLALALRAWAAIAIMAACAAAAYVLVGLNPGPPLLAGLALVAAVLLLGRRAAVLVLVAYVVFLAAATAALWTGVWSGPPPAESNDQDAVIWLRTSVLSLIIWMTTAYGVYFVVNTVEKTLGQREDALARLRLEIAQREAAENAQREAEALAQQSQKLESLGHLAAGVAHDFNNALLVVQGWNDILRHSNTPENRIKGADAIQQATEQAGQLARQLLTFARQQVRSPRYLVAGNVISNAVATLSPLLPPAFRIIEQSEPDAAFFADAGQIQQLLFNLIINARDAMPDGGDIVISGRRVARQEIEDAFPDIHRSEDWIELTVRDQGTGIDETVRDRIFEPFFTTKDVGKGTGLGLSTAFGIVRQSGGHIGVQTRAGLGSTFTVYFPAVQLAPGRPQAAASPRGQAVSINRALVLEDDMLARELIAFALGEQNISIDLASDGDEALKMIERLGERIDILCTDAVFPGAPLADVIAAYRAAAPSGRVLICSGYVRESLTIEGLEAGEFDFLAKPFTATQLVEKIRSLGQ